MGQYLFKIIWFQRIGDRNWKQQSFVVGVSIEDAQAKFFLALKTINGPRPIGADAQQMFEWNQCQIICSGIGSIKFLASTLKDHNPEMKLLVLGDK